MCFYLLNDGWKHLTGQTEFQENRLEKENGVDLFEAEIARACTAIRKQAAGMPHSFRECSVCLSANAYAQISSCGHTFHPACFLRWFRLNRSCPLCRGVVDKVQLAQTIVVQDELEAIMAELDDEPLQLMPTEQNVPQMPRSEADVAALDDPLLANSEQLMSFLESDFDTDMELAALDDLSNDTGTFELMANPTAMREADGDETMGMELDDIRDQVKSEVMPTYTPNNFVAPAPAPVPQQFAPASAMPNYWNVLNQGMAPPVMPPAPAVPPVVAAHQRMVHIAPKPDARTMQQQRVPAPTAVRASEPTFKPTAFQVHQSHHHSHSHNHQHVRVSSAPPRVVSCRCTGGCRNGRCACVKEGGMCGVSCRCTSCKNPFLMVKAAGADIDALLKDDCFMHNVSKTRDMVQRLQEPVAVPCCDSTIKVIDCVQGYKCTQCRRQYDFSWCMNKLLDSERTPRNHCAICKRCCDHRDVHCNDCGRCYFAGVATSLPCPCKEASHHKKRREAAAKNKAEEAEEEAEGECCIM
ncbi:hypothetical protein BBJ29_005480 [Phytophthora kernoviae]|uniref:RING-type domain-containing protein n=1 Tax=Phytophthora kernoviae TaxID=325452 RepID=A0A3R7N4E5_9STRA|nr:hypothetical protein BBJ29_005480 [Phytophthora kernoviae]